MGNDDRVCASGGSPAGDVGVARWVGRELAEAGGEGEAISLENFLSHTYPQQARNVRIIVDSDRHRSLELQQVKSAASEKIDHHLACACLSGVASSSYRTHYQEGFNLLPTIINNVDATHFIESWVMFSLFASFLLDIGQTKTYLSCRLIIAVGGFMTCQNITPPELDWASSSA